MLTLGAWYPLKRMHSVLSTGNVVSIFEGTHNTVSYLSYGGYYSSSIAVESLQLFYKLSKPVCIAHNLLYEAVLGVSSLRRWWWGKRRFAEEGFYVLRRQQRMKNARE